MKGLKEDFLNIVRSDKAVLVLMILNFLLAVLLLVLSLINLNPNSAMIKTGYGDIGGYRDGSWTNQFTFSLAAILFGILHNLLVLKIFRKRGAGMAKFFLVTTVMLILGAFVVMFRLLKEG
ncbi:MAG: hypothetical protein K6G36_01635 [Candidatus Saccharibacteria bacterium]|nr:hypothetical protein [Candidatus Saccharibacteria bacterium]